MNQTAKVLLIVCGILMGLPILACGGCLMLGAIMNASITPEQREKFQADYDARVKADKEQSDKRRAEDAKLADIDAKRPQPNMTNYQRLKDGMKYSEVVAIIGEPTEELSRSSIGGIQTVMYMWRANSLGANMNAMFQNGRLVQKAQFGLPQGQASEPLPEVIPDGIYIKGMSIEPIDKFLKGKGFSASTDESGAHDVWKFDCYKPVLSVVIRGDAPNKIMSIRAICADKDASRENLQFLLDMATVPYTNADKEKSVKWVQDNFAADATQTFGEAKFHIFSVGGLAMLDIEPKK